MSGKKMPSEEIIKKYIDEDFWNEKIKRFDVDKTLGLHFGFYEKGIHNHADAVINMNNYIERLLELKNRSKKIERILDAGCGFGGTVIYLAKKHPEISFYGISINPQEVKLARYFAQERHVLSNTQFIAADYENTVFPSNYFDCVIAVESLSYSNKSKQKKFIIEMNRILKPGGKLVVIDGFFSKIPSNSFMKKMVDIYEEKRKFEFYIESEFNKSVLYSEESSLPELEEINKFASYLKEYGFLNVNIKDISKNISPSVMKNSFLLINSLFSKDKKIKMLKDMRTISFYDSLMYFFSVFFTKVGKIIRYYTIISVKK